MGESVLVFVEEARADLARYGATLETAQAIARTSALVAYGMSPGERAEMAMRLRQLAIEHDIDPGPVVALHRDNLAELNNDVARSGTPLRGAVGNMQMPSPKNTSVDTHTEDGLIRVLTLEDLFATADQDVPFLLEDVIPAQGVTTLVGASGSGKTHFDRGLIRGLAAGDEFMGGLKLPGTEVRVLLVSEWSQSLLGTVLLKYWGAGAVGLPIDFITAKVGLAAWESAARMVDDLIKRQRSEEYGLIVIDTLRTFGRLRDENDNAELSRVMVEFIRLADEGVPVRLSHHTAKAATVKSSPQIACAGAHSIPSLSTQTVALSRKPNSNTVSLWSSGDVIEAKHEMHWDEEAKLFLPLGEKAGPCGLDTERAKVLVLQAAETLDSNNPRAWHPKKALQVAVQQEGGLRREALNRAIDSLTESGGLDCNRDQHHPRYRIASPRSPS